MHAVSINFARCLCNGTRQNCSGSNLCVERLSACNTHFNITTVRCVIHTVGFAGTARQVLQGYDRRYDRLVDWVSETEGTFREDRLAEVSIADLLINPVSESADLWRTDGQ